jgi:hypothetical protein
MYITSSEYATLTGRAASEATTLRLKIACKLLDSRIGNYPTLSDGYKIRSSDFAIIYQGQYQILHQSKIDAVKMWVAVMISYLTDNGNKPPTVANNIKLGRFSVGKSTPSTSSNLPGELGFADSILVSSGIINRRIKMA